MMAIALTVGCTEQKRTSTEDVGDTDADSAMVATDEDGWLPKAAENLFDDFFYNFATNSYVQAKRICFPLPVADGRKTSRIDSTEWQMDQFYMEKGEMTLLFDNIEQMDLTRDTTVSEAIVERIMLDVDTVVQYMFSRATGRWMLENVCLQTIGNNRNASFLTFYKQFVADSVYQRKSLNKEIAFSGPDPDDEFEEMEGVITPDFWDAFAPELPSGTIYNVVYGLPGHRSDSIVFVIRRLADDAETDITFKRHNGKWKLMKLTE